MRGGAGRGVVVRKNVALRLTYCAQLSVTGYRKRSSAGCPKHPHPRCAQQCAHYNIYEQYYPHLRQYTSMLRGMSSLPFAEGICGKIPENYWISQKIAYICRVNADCATALLTDS
jgi:hypothetical protein